MAIKAIFFDLDGTLYSHSTKQVPKSTQWALTKLREKGIKTILATGRHISEVRQFDFLDTYQFDAYITVNGQCCFDQDGMIYDEPIAKEDIEALLGHIEEDPYPCIFMEKDRIFINHFNSHVYEEYKHLGTNLPELDDQDRARTTSIYQACPFFNIEKEKELLKRTKNVKITRWTDHVVDLLPVSGGKDAGIQATLERYGLSKEESMAFGDALNDLPMFERTGVKVCMGNGHPDLKEKADYVCDDIDEDGLYKALCHFGFLE